MDIVDMLRNITMQTDAVCRNAADEIENLRAKLLSESSAVPVLIQAIESSGFSLSGPTDVRAAEHGEPAWVCNARAVIAEATAQNHS